MQYELDEREVKNLLEFLNRVSAKGFTEANELLLLANKFQAFYKPKKENEQGASNPEESLPIKEKSNENRKEKTKNEQWRGKNI